MEIDFNPQCINSYRTFLRLKTLPSYRIRGRVGYCPDQYAHLMDETSTAATRDFNSQSDFLFDYQRAISEMAYNNRKFAIFADCGLGKTLIYFEWIDHVMRELTDKGTLIVSPAMVIAQTISECKKWFGDRLDIEHVKARDLSTWLSSCGGKVGITNYEAIKPNLDRGKLGALVLDESSMLKSHYGKWGTKLIELGDGINWKLAGTGTPAPNDRIEYANHAVFLDAVPTVNAFLAKYFVNRGQTGERWELKQHALGTFYRSLSHWSIFLTNPATYGWKDNTNVLPPIHVHIDNVELTNEQEKLAFEQHGQLFANELGGIATRASYGQIAKGHYKGSRIDSNKPEFIRQLINDWIDHESTIAWCIYNEEQNILAETLPESASITGATPMDERLDIIDRFKTGDIRTLITKPKILGFGLNLQICTRQVFSGLQDSYESFYQAVKRSNRIGSTKPLNVHIPITDLEQPMVDTVLKKARRVEADTKEQERIFKEHACLL